jgi:hypothetical protein
MELHDALGQIAEIRQQVARAEVFRGYRSIPIAFSSGAAFLGAALQESWVPDPGGVPLAYVRFWLIAAVVSLAASAATLLVRYQRTESILARNMTWLAVGQFLPCLVAGGLATLVLACAAEDSLHLLPGLWAVLFSLGIFASARLLPRPAFWIGQYYLAAGLLTLLLAQGEHAFAPLAMAGTFGIGQALAALMFYWTLERHHEASHSTSI